LFFFQVPNFNSLEAKVQKAERRSGIFVRCTGRRLLRCGSCPLNRREFNGLTGLRYLAAQQAPFARTGVGAENREALSLRRDAD